MTRFISNVNRCWSSLCSPVSIQEDYKVEKRTENRKSISIPTHHRDIMLQFTFQYHSWKNMISFGFNVSVLQNYCLKQKFSRAYTFMWPVQGLHGLSMLFHGRRRLPLGDRQSSGRIDLRLARNGQIHARFVSTDRLLAPQLDIFWACGQGFRFKYHRGLLNRVVWSPLRQKL